MINLTPKLIRRVALCCAFVIAPMMVMGAAYLVEGQMLQVKEKQAEIQQPKAAKKVALSRRDADQIAIAIESLKNI